MAIDSESLDQLERICLDFASRTALESESTRDILRRANEYRDTFGRLFRFDVDLGDGALDVREDVANVN